MMSDEQQQPRPTSIQAAIAMYRFCVDDPALRSAVVLYDWEDAVRTDDMPEFAWVDAAGSVDEPTHQELMRLAVLAGRLLKIATDGMHDKAYALQLRLLELQQHQIIAERQLCSLLSKAGSDEHIAKQEENGCPVKCSGCADGGYQPDPEPIGADDSLQY